MNDDPKKKEEQKEENEDEKDSEQKYMKLKYKQVVLNNGSTVSRQIPLITCCKYLDKVGLLAISFIDKVIRFFKIRGSVNNLDVKQTEHTFKSPFIVSKFSTGLHKLSREQIGVLIGEGMMMQIYIDPKSPKFLENVTTLQTNG